MNHINIAAAGFPALTGTRIKLNVGESITSMTAPSAMGADALDGL
jgi:hypothetical protein